MVPSKNTHLLGPKSMQLIKSDVAWVIKFFKKHTKCNKKYTLKSQDLAYFVILITFLLNCQLYLVEYPCPEGTKQIEPILRAKVRIFFKSENLKKCF
jgi:hypothetical protein